MHTEGLQAWLALLIEMASEVEARNEEWFKGLLQQWRVQATVPDLGCTLDDGWSREHLSVVVELARRTRERLREPSTEAHMLDPTWSVLDELPVAGGVGSHNLMLRVNEVAKAFIDLLDGSLAEAPDGTWWAVGWGQGDRDTIRKRDDA